jgi:hypothetical protein
MGTLRLTLGLILGLMTPITGASALNTVVDFESVSLDSSGYDDEPDPAGGFLIGETFFDNTYSFGCCFDGWAISNHTDTTTPGFGNQFSAYPGAGVGGSSQYAIAYTDSATITLPFATTVVGGSFANTTYAALSMLNGDAFAKKFGGVSGDDPDYFNITIEGYQGGIFVDSLVFDLADYTGASQDDYVVEDWTFVDLSGLGVVDELQFTFASSDVGQFGINTPSYFALDNLEFVPEPSSGLMLSLGLIGLSGRRQSSHSRRRST